VLRVVEIASLHSAKKHMEGELSYPHYTIVVNIQNIVFSMTYCVPNAESNLKI